MIRSILFATSNEAKVEQFQYVADSYKFNIKIVPAKRIFGALVKYDEIGDSPKEITKQGAEVIFNKIKRPIITESSLLFISPLKNFPGVESGEFLSKKGRKGILNMLNGVSSRKARIESAITYINEEGVAKTFNNIVKGDITKEEKWKKGPTWVSPSEHPLGGGYNAIFKPEGSRFTLAEMTASQLLKKGYREPNFLRVLKILDNEEETE